MHSEPHTVVENPPVQIMSFGFRYGEPRIAGIKIIDLRTLRNPHHDRRLRQLNGLHPDVRKDVLSNGRAMRIIAQTLEEIKRGEVNAVGFGCLAGRHRSVVMAEELFRRLCATPIDAEVWHREYDRWA